ncbi:hypothetical protein BGI32_03830 [Snodgrassella alvi]|uniref:Uncharacterized protein n=1 Tax=Snodgrassella alvi TaxID=1196083 RepID=A0A2N9WV15_9NEIS|nr:hypothetical protein BGI32_03830 [Snodgrassella alvi]
MVIPCLFVIFAVTHDKLGYSKVWLLCVGFNVLVLAVNRYELSFATMAGVFTQLIHWIRK